MDPPSYDDAERMASRVMRMQADSNARKNSYAPPPAHAPPPYHTPQRAPEGTSIFTFVMLTILGLGVWGVYAFVQPSATNPAIAADTPPQYDRPAPQPIPVPARLEFGPQPPYPDALIGITSPVDVVVEIFVREDGTVGEIRTLHTDDTRAVQPVYDAVSGWRFAPAQENNQPIGSWTTERFHFAPSPAELPPDNPKSQGTDSPLDPKTTFPESPEYSKGKFPSESYSPEVRYLLDLYEQHQRDCNASEDKDCAETEMKLREALRQAGVSESAY